jgi:hypothetical protein
MMQWQCASTCVMKLSLFTKWIFSKGLIKEKNTCKRRPIPESIAWIWSVPWLSMDVAISSPNIVVEQFTAAVDSACLVHLGLALVDRSKAQQMQIPMEVFVVYANVT